MNLIPKASLHERFTTVALFNPSCGSLFSFMLPPFVFRETSYTGTCPLIRGHPDPKRMEEKGRKIENNEPPEGLKNATVAKRSCKTNLMQIVECSHGFENKGTKEFFFLSSFSSVD